MTDHDVLPGTQPPGTGEPADQPPSRAPGSALARARRLAGQHKLGTAIAVLLVAAAVVGVSTGSLDGKPTASTSGGTGTGTGTGSSDTTIVYSHPAAAPAFSLAALTAAGPAGGTASGTATRVSLSDYQGKPLIVNFFASWCAPCQQETPLLARYYKAHRVTMVGVDGNDPTANAAAFVRAKGVTYPVGVDPNLITASAYNVSGFPQTFFLNARHQVVYRVIGGVTQAELSEGTQLMGR